MTDNQRERIHEIVYSTDSREELAERIVALEELAEDLLFVVCDGCHERLCEMPIEEHPNVTCDYDNRRKALGVTAS